MKRLLLFIVGMSFLFSCEYQDNGVTSINDVITSDYLLAGNLDVYLQNSQVFRHKGKPGIETITIGNENLSDFEECFVMYVATGTTKATTVSSAIIKLDNMVVLSTSDFSKNTGQHIFEVCNLTPTSVLTVEVRGEPGSYIDIWIEGKLKCPCNVSDIDGNVYNAVKIGDQCWMTENLKVTHYRNSDVIPKVTDVATWRDITTAAYCDYRNNEDYSAVYGRLYNWYTMIDSRNLCPLGWHIPSKQEFETLLNTFGGPGENAYNQLLPTGSSGFNGLINGWRSSNGYFSVVDNNVAHFWSITEFNSEYSSDLHLVVGELAAIVWPDEHKNCGLSVRCIKDN